MEEYGTKLWEKMIRDFECTGVAGMDLNYDPQLPALDALIETDNAETDLYFYHGDHLGSSSYITDINGDATQHMEYLPFGEDFIQEQNATSYYTPYTFSGKERDMETQYSYFGARYYDAGLSIWLSVDPMADKYPAWSPYAYTLQNPVVLIDPTGMSAEWFETPDGQIQFDPTITSQADLDGRGIQGTYLGAQGIGVNQQTGMADMYNADGTITPNVGMLSGPTIDISAPMTDHQRTMSNPVVQAVHRGQGEFVAGALDVMGNALNTVGTATTVVGYGTTMIPGGQVLGGGLIGLGNTMTGASGALSAGGDLMRGDVTGAAINLGFNAAGRVNNRLFGALESRGAISSLDRQILQTGADLKISIASFMYNH